MPKVFLIIGITFFRNVVTLFKHISVEIRQRNPAASCLFSCLFAKLPGLWGCSLFNDGEFHMVASRSFFSSINYTPTVQENSYWKIAQTKPGNLEDIHGNKHDTPGFRCHKMVEICLLTVAPLVTNGKKQPYACFPLYLLNYLFQFGRLLDYKTKDIYCWIRSMAVASCIARNAGVSSDHNFP